MNKLIIEDKEYTLSDELIEKIKAEVEEQEKKKNPFEKMTHDTYYYINSFGAIDWVVDGKFSSDNDLYIIANYCRDKRLMEQRALYETLNRLLWRYSVEHDGEIVNYGIDTLFQIDYNISAHTFIIGWSNTRITNGVVYFKTEETARNAIKEVIEPFLEEHPEFDYFRW